MQIWRIRQRWILELIKLLLFFLSFVVGQSIFFAVFFGPDSCFFSQTGGWRPMLLLQLPASHLVWAVCCSDGCHTRCVCMLDLLCQACLTPAG